MSIVTSEVSRAQNAALVSAERRWLSWQGEFSRRSELTRPRLAAVRRASASARHPHPHPHRHQPGIRIRIGIGIGIGISQRSKRRIDLVRNGCQGARAGISERVRKDCRYRGLTISG